MADRRRVLAAILALALLALSAAPARAASPAASPPTPGALYRDGQTGR